MKVFIWISMLLIFVGCKRDKELTPKEITSLVGKWHQVASEETTQQGKEWVPVTESNKYNTLIFRSDGVLLYENGKGMCCAPGTLVIEGRRFKIVPKSPVELDDLCALVDCVICESVEIELNHNQMIWTSCTGYRARYQRVP